MSEHWLDRLAAPQTRREGFKSALAGAALALPFTTGTARADNPGGSTPNACRNGCYFKNQRTTNRELQRCHADAHTAVSFATGLGGFVTLLLTAKARSTERYCVDRALLVEKATAYDCLQPDCPGFDPYGELGPCEPCAAVPGCLCCPSQVSSTGYDSCTSPPYCCGTAPGGFGCVPCG